MEIREVIRLKPGAGGLDPPMNYGILLERVRSRKENSSLVFTLKGKLTLRNRQLKEGTGTIYPGDKGDEAGMTGFLKDVISREKSRNVLKKDQQQIINETTVEDLWRSVSHGGVPAKEFNITDVTNLPHYCDHTALSPEEIGLAHFSGYSLDPGQIAGISKILSASHPSSEPYFHRLNVDGKTGYAPYFKTAVDDIEDHIHRLRELKSNFIEWVDDESETGRLRKIPRRKMEGIRDIVLPEFLKPDMEVIISWSLFFIENGRWPSSGGGGIKANDREIPIFGLGGTPVVRYGKFQLEDYMDLFAMDMVGSRKRDLPSNIILLLLKLERITWKEASDLIIKFHMASGASKFRGRFPDHVTRSADALPNGVEPGEEEGRIDLTDLETFTIDPVDAKDFDDAVSLEADEDGVVIWVHIADVSHYVRPHDLIDTEARFRGTSVYLPTGVIPMLPGRLSEDLCSLREGVNRLAVSTRIVFDREMNIREWEHFTSVIRVDRNLTYDQVNEWIEGGLEPFSDLWNLAEALEKRYERLRMDTPERRIRFNDPNDITIEVKRPTKATRLIEQLMVVTNECAAKFLNERDIPTVYRVHPMPDRVSVEKFNGACEAMEINASIDMDWIEEDGKGDTMDGEGMILSSLLSGGKITLGGGPIGMDGEDDIETDETQPDLDPIDLDRMAKALNSFNSALKRIDEIGDGDTSDIIRVRMLRTMPRAFYSFHNLGHFGLGSAFYCHFTSPIRRYPDVIVHRAIKNVISGGSEGLEKEPDLEILIDGINEMTQMAEDWERQMIDVALSIRAEMVPEIRNGVHPCRINSISASSCFITMEDHVTEGRLPVSRLDHWHLAVDESESRVILDLNDNPDYLKEHSGELTSDQISEGEIVLHRLGDTIRCGIFNIQPAWGKIEMHRG